ncbi:prepilin-type N-terminal cleavage/methylation domain-containing protein [bacterium]|nr:prepilin-type N-terminal cleavage/methylation domain-containing protein [bacterium]
MHRNRGFTLIELLVVIAIIGMLSTVVLASFSSARKKGVDARRVGDIKQVQLALELYNDANGTYPVQGTLGSIPAGLAPTFISVVPTDPKNSSPYVYQYISTDGAASPAACSATACAGYVLRADLETQGHTSLANDIDGTPAGVDCADISTTNYYYCVQP